MTESINDTAGGEVMVVEDPAGALVVGDQSTLDAFIAEWAARGVEIESTTEVTGSTRAQALSMAMNVATAAPAAVRYLQLKRQNSMPPGCKAEFRKLVRGPNGRFISNRPFDPKQLAKANPEVMIASAAIQLALADATREITAALERVEDKTDDLLRLANAEQAGDVNGHHRLLSRMVRDIESGTALTSTDWSSIAGLGPKLEVAVERLRGYLVRLVKDLPIAAPADERADRLGKAAEQQRLGETLQLLIVSEQSLYLWQRLRVERVETSEPEHVDQTIASAHAILAEHLTADLELVNDLRDVLVAYGSIGVSEFHRKLSGRRLRRHISALQSDLDMFVEARGIQIGEWKPLSQATARDAVTAAGRVIAGQGRHVKAVGGRAFDATLGGVGRFGGAVQQKAEQLRGNRSGGDTTGDDTI